MSDVYSDALALQRLVDEFRKFNPYADQVSLHNFAGWLAARGAHLDAERDALKAENARLVDILRAVIRDALHYDVEHLPDYWRNIAPGKPFRVALERAHDLLRGSALEGSQ